MVYLKVLKYILLRETSYRRLVTLLDSLEMSYWRYSCVVIDRIQFGKSLMTDDLTSLRKLISSHQEELCIAIAHHRTLTINVVEGVMRLDFFHFLS